MSLNKYNYSKIYAIYCPSSDDELLYIGSTTKQYLCSRLAEHRSNFKRFLQGGIVGKSTCFEIFNKYGVENCKIKLLEHKIIDNYYENFNYPTANKLYKIMKDDNISVTKKDVETYISSLEEVQITKEVKAPKKMGILRLWHLIKFGR